MHVQATYVNIDTCIAVLGGILTSSHSVQECTYIFFESGFFLGPACHVNCPRCGKSRCGGPRWLSSSWPGGQPSLAVIPTLCTRL